MSVVLDEQTDIVVLEGLDFEIKCERGDHAAEVIVQCRRCFAGSPLCKPHCRESRERVDLFVATHRDVELVCSGCGARSDDIDELIEVVPL